MSDTKNGYQYWENLSQEEKDRTKCLIPSSFCIGVVKTGHRFRIILPVDITKPEEQQREILENTSGDAETNEAVELRILSQDLQKLYDEAYILPHNVAMWPGHGLQYLNFHDHVDTAVRATLNGQALSSGSYSRTRSTTPREGVSESKFKIMLPSGRGMSFSAKLQYAGLGVYLSCHAVITKPDGSGHPVLAATNLLLPDDDTAVTIMKSLFAATCTKQHVANAESEISKEKITGI